MDALCFECGELAIYDHHVVPKSLGGTKTVPLCHACHSKIHGKNLALPSMIKDALKKKKDAGLVYGSIPYGFKRGPDGETIIKDEEEQNTIQIIIGLRNAGKTKKEIVDELNNRNIPIRKEGDTTNDRVEKWTHSIIYCILKQAKVETPQHIRGCRYGYTWKQGDFENQIPDEAEQKVIQTMTALRLKSMSYRQIADELNKMEIPTRRGKPWIMMTVRAVLVREKLPTPSSTWHGKPIYDSSPVQ